MENGKKVTYSLKEPEGGWPEPNHFDRFDFTHSSERIKANVDAELLWEIKQGSITESQANTEFGHRVMLAAIEKYKDNSKGEFFDGKVPRYERTETR